MNDPARSNDRLRSILVILATVATIGFNALAATGYINGITPAEISDRFPTIITPAGYAFSIWSLIYVGLLAFSVYQTLSANLERFSRVRTLYIASCVLNCAWIYFWHHAYIGVCAVLIIALAIVLIAITSMYKVAVSMTEALIVKATFGLYAGWVTVASIVNIAVYLKSIGSPTATSETVGVLAVIIATAASIAVTWKLANYLYPVAVAWALTAIAVNQSGKTAIVIACACGVIICLLLAISFVLAMPSTARPEPSNE
jgi:benzodiazapine receptor